MKKPKNNRIYNSKGVIVFDQKQSEKYKRTKGKTRTNTQAQINDLQSLWDANYLFN